MSANDWGSPLIIACYLSQVWKTLVKVNQEKLTRDVRANIINYSSRYQIEELGAVQTEKQGKKDETRIPKEKVAQIVVH